MVKRTGPTNELMKAAVSSMGRHGEAGVWKDVAEKMSKPTRSRIEVNVAEISRNSKSGEMIVVPGIVLSSGDIDKKVSVAAWRFSGSAQKKIIGAGGKAMSIEQMKKENPKGTNVRLMV